MWRLYLAIALFGLFLVVPLGDHSGAYGQGPGCTYNASCTAPDDYGDNPLCQTDTYWPCGYWVKWSISFHRTDEEDGSTILWYKLPACHLNKPFDSIYYSPSEYHECYGYEYCGPSGSHRLSLYASGIRGHFDNILVKANYYDTNPAGGED